MDNQESTGIYYHYTDDKGVKGITKEKKIRPSTDQQRDAMIGKGVYLTTKNPEEHTKEEILRNNYGTAGPGNPDKVKHAFKINIPISHVEKAENSSRDVYKYKGEDELDLNKYPHEIFEVDKQGRSQGKWPGVPGPLRLLFPVLLRLISHLLRALDYLLRALDFLDFLDFVSLHLLLLRVWFYLSPLIFLFLTYLLYGLIFDSPDCSLVHSPSEIPPVFYCSASGDCTYGTEGPAFLNRNQDPLTDPCGFSNHKMPPVVWYKFCFCGLVSAFSLLSFWWVVFLFVPSHFRQEMLSHLEVFNSTSSDRRGQDSLYSSLGRRDPDFLNPTQYPLIYHRYEPPGSPMGWDRFTTSARVLGRQIRCEYFQ